MADHYKLTIAGGIRLEAGPLAKIVLAIQAQPEGRTVFVRHEKSPQNVLELTTPASSPIFTSFGAQQHLPSWASTLISTINSYYKGPPS